MNTLQKKQRRICRTDVKLIINPQRVDNETKFSSSDIFQQTQAQPSPDSPASGRSPIFPPLLWKLPDHITFSNLSSLHAPLIRFSFPRCCHFQELGVLSPGAMFFLPFACTQDRLRQRDRLLPVPTLPSAHCRTFPACLRGQHGPFSSGCEATRKALIAFLV